MSVGRGGGGHGGGHGRGGRGGGWSYAASPWVYDVSDYGDDDPRVLHHPRFVGQETFSTGEGAVMMLVLLAVLVYYADKRVPR